MENCKEFCKRIGWERIEIFEKCPDENSFDNWFLEYIETNIYHLLCETAYDTLINLGFNKDASKSIADSYEAFKHQDLLYWIIEHLNLSRK
jgi:hypothetical protein